MKVFISHSSTDKAFVRMLKDCLIANNIDIWLDEDELDLGDSLLLKLEQALNESSHLVLVLSPSSVKSEWVKLELKKALENTSTGLMNKIIVVKYQECEIPEELKENLYGDLSNEVVMPAGDRIKFISGGFEKFLLSLVRAVRNSAKTINNDEKAEIISSIKSSEKEVSEFVSKIYRANYELIGFAVPENQRKYEDIVKKGNKSLKSEEHVYPFLLPAGLKNVLNLNIGDVVKIESDLPFPAYGHFAGYRVDDLKIVLHPQTRRELYLKNHQIYQVEVDPEKNSIRFVNNSEFIKPPNSPFAGENNYALAA